MTKQRLHLDFETRSTVDLMQAGLHIYADPSKTEVLVCAWAFDDGPICRWFLDERLDTPLFRMVLDHIALGGEVVAHNASFEFEIWNKVFFPNQPLKLEQMTCTMAMAYAMGLPGNLEGCAAALGVSQQKDMEGSRLMKQMSKPRDILPDGTVTWWDEPEKMARLVAYCEQDVRVEREVEKRMFALSPYEKRVWQLDQKINSRGMAVDKKAIEKAVALVELEKENIDKKMRALTSDNVATCGAIQQMKDYLQFFGVDEDSLSKSDVSGLLEKPDLHPQARAVLELRSQGGKAATAKLDRILGGVGIDNRIRGCFQYSAAGTRRWGGRRVQLQNLKRPSLSHHLINDIIQDISDGRSCLYIDIMYGPPLNIIAECTRGFLTATPGNQLMVADFSAIEARVLAWLSYQEDVLDIFRSGKDIYLIQASQIFRVPITDKNDYRRQIGKVAILALGYQGGVGAFQQMAKGYGVKMEPAFNELWNAVNDDVREAALYRYESAKEKYDISKEEFLASEVTKIMWREANSSTVKYWALAEQQFINAIKNPGVTFSLGGHYRRPVRFKKAGSFLWCKLPGGGVICYPYPELRETKTPWGAKKELPTYMGVDTQSNKWIRFSTYGGSIVENITQSVARDLLADAMLRVEEAGYPITAHVHDELICDVKPGHGSISELERIMAQNPPWAYGLPLAASGWTGFRYRK